MWKFWLSFLLIVLMIPLIPFAIFGELPGESWVEHPNPIYVFFVGASVLVSDIFLPVPSSLIALFMGAKLGFVMATFAIMLGLTIGCIAGYYFGYYFGYPVVNKYAAGKKRDFIDKVFNKYGLLSLAMLRAIPLLAEASVLASGAARLRSKPVFLVLSLANLSLAIMYAWLGDKSQSEISPGTLFLGGILVPTVTVVFVYAIHFTINFFQRKPQA